MQVSLEVHTVKIKPFTADMFKELLSLDNDFDNDSSRISNEFSNKFRVDWDSNEESHSDEFFFGLVSDYIDKVVNVSLGDNRFLLTNDTYVQQNHIVVVQPEDVEYDGEITVVVSYTSK